MLEGATLTYITTIGTDGGFNPLNTLEDHATFPPPEAPVQSKYKQIPRQPNLAYTPNNYDTQNTRSW